MDFSVRKDGCPGRRALGESAVAQSMSGWKKQLFGLLFNHTGSKYR